MRCCFVGRPMRQDEADSDAASSYTPRSPKAPEGLKRLRASLTKLSKKLREGLLPDSTTSAASVGSRRDELRVELRVGQEVTAVSADCPAGTATPASAKDVAAGAAQLGSSPTPPTERTTPSKASTARPASADLENSVHHLCPAQAPLASPPGRPVLPEWDDGRTHTSSCGDGGGTSQIGGGDHASGRPPSLPFPPSAPLPPLAPLAASRDSGLPPRSCPGIAARPQSGSGFLETASRQIARGEHTLHASQQQQQQREEEEEQEDGQEGQATYGGTNEALRGVGDGGVRMVRLARGVRSPRTSNRALLTRQRTPYALRRFMGGSVEGPLAMLDMPASAVAAASSFKYSAAVAAHRRHQDGAAAAAVEAEPSSSAAAAGPVSPARPPLVRFGIRPLDLVVSVQADGGEGQLLSPRTTAPALLARQATPCPLRWGRLEDSWDGASEAVLSNTLSHAFSHVYSTVAGNAEACEVDAGFRGRSAAGCMDARLTVDGGAGGSLHGEVSDRLSNVGVRGFSRAGSQRSGRGPSCGGGHPHPHRALRVQVSLAKSRRSSVSSLVSVAGLDPADHADGSAAVPALLVSLRTGGGGSSGFGGMGGGNTPTRRGRRRFNLAGNESLGWEQLVPRAPFGIPAPLVPPSAASGARLPPLPMSAVPAVPPLAPATPLAPIDLLGSGDVTASAAHSFRTAAPLLPPPQPSFAAMMVAVPVSCERTREMTGHLGPESAFPRPDLPHAPDMAAEFAPASSSRGSSTGGQCSVLPLPSFHFSPPPVQPRNPSAGWYGGVRVTQSSDGRGALPMSSSSAFVGTKGPIPTILAVGGAARVMRRSCLSMSRPASASNIAAAATSVTGCSIDGTVASSGRLGGTGAREGRRVLQHAGSTRSHAPTEDDSAESLAKLTSGPQGGCSPWDKGAEELIDSCDTIGGAPSGRRDVHGRGPAAEEAEEEVDAEDCIAEGIVLLGSGELLMPMAAGPAAAVGPLPSPLRHILVNELLKASFTSAGGGGGGGGGSGSSRLSRCTTLSKQERVSLSGAQLPSPPLGRAADNVSGVQQYGRRG